MNNVDELFANNASAAWCVFVKIDLEGMETGRFVNNNETTTLENAYDIQMTGDYLPFAFDIQLPDSNADKASQVKLVLDNVDRRMVDALRRAIAPANVSIAIGMVERYKLVGSVWEVDYEIGVAKCQYGPELSITELQLIDVSWDVSQITGTLILDDILNRKFPSNHPLYSPDIWKALF